MIKFDEMKITGLFFLLLVCSNMRRGHSSNLLDFTSQLDHRIQKRENDPVLIIECLMNCPPYVPVCDVNQRVILEATCIANCEAIPKNQYLWTVHDEDFNYDTGTNEFGRNGNIVILSPNALKLGKSYNVDVILTGQFSSKASTVLKTHIAPKLLSAQISPTIGDALKTKFLLECRPESGPYDFEIYALSDGSAFLLQRGKKCSEMPFVLSSETKKVKVKMIDEYEYFDSKILDVTVKPVLRPVTSETELENEIQKQYFDSPSPDSISSLKESRRYDQLLQVLNVFCDDLEKISKDGDREDTVKKYQTEVLNILSQVPMVSRELTKQAASIAAKVAKSIKLKSDPDIASIASQVCEEAASGSLAILKKEAYPKSMEQEIQENSQMFAECSQSGTLPNMEILEVGVPVSEPSTPFPVLDLPAIVEDYPDYVDDQNIPKILSKFEDSSRSMVNICYLSSKTLALSMSVKDYHRSVRYQNFEVTATKAFGVDVPSTRVVSQKVELFGSKDFVPLGRREVEILLCTCTVNPFWWTKKQPTTTSVVILQFQTNQNIVETFTDPIDIVLENFDPNPTFISHSSVTPRTVRSNGSEEAKAYEKFAIFRIDVSKNQGYFIEFQDLADNISLDVFVSVFQKPSIATFKSQSTVIRKDNNIKFVPNELEHDSWHYLTVLPNKIMGDVEVKFNFEVYATSCYHWNESLTDWQFSCGAAESSSKTKIHCLCYHASVLTGRITNNVVREEVDEFVEHQLQTQASLIVFVSVAVVFFVYCIVLTYLSLVPNDGESRKSVFFLSDVPGFCRFGYLVIVKTGNATCAGTTSNVVLKIYGEKTQSLEHVLNFPDPDKKLLQRNQEDWFFLATEHHLGEIEKIELWFDHLGLRPYWYCREVSIIDFQMKNYWFFNVDFKFEISENTENYFCTVYPIKPEQYCRTTKFLLKRISLGLQGPHMWNIFQSDEATFSRTKRLTIMLSIFLTTYSAILFIYGCPKMKVNDSLGQYKEYEFNASIIWASVGGLATTFSIHLPIVHFFRYCHGQNEIENTERNGKIHKIDMACWCSMIVLIIASMTLLIVLGFWVPHITSLLWLTSSVASLVTYIFLVENITRIIYNLTSNMEKVAYNIIRGVKHVVASIEAQRVKIYSRFGQAALRPYFEHLYRPLEASKVKEIRQDAKMKQKILEVVEDLIMIMIYVVLLYIVILKDKDPLLQLSNEEVKDLVMGIHSRTHNEITYRQQIEQYVRDTLIVSTQALRWYGRHVSEDPGVTIDRANEYLGVARLRQARSDARRCSVHPAMRSVSEACVAGFGAGPQRVNFSEAWSAPDTADRFDRLGGVWKFRRAKETQTLGYVGKFGTYPGSGYVFPLGRNMKNSLINANYMVRNKWLDEYTRCLSIEFLMYCSNTNLFNSVDVKFEISTTGYVRSIFNVQTARLLFIKEKTSNLIRFILASFVFVVLILAIKMILKIVRKRKLIFKDLWNMVDIVIISMSLACIFLYMNRANLVKSFLQKLEKAKHNEFINYFHLFHAENVLTSLASALVFLATVRLWKLLRFFLIIKIVEKTLILSAVPLLCLFLWHLVVLLSFTLAGAVLFGDQSFDFKDIPDTLMTMTLLSLCLHEKFDFNVLITPLHYFYYSLYMIASLLIINLYIAIITICYGDAQIFYSNDESYTVVNYLRDQFGYYSGLFQVKVEGLRGGGDSERVEGEPMISPKADEHRYAKCLTVPKTRIDAMAAVTWTVLRNKTKRDVSPGENDDLIKKTLVSLFREDTEEQDYFFISNVQGSKATLVDDLKFLKMERIVALLLGKSNVSQQERAEELCKRILQKNSGRMDKISGSLEVMMNALKKIEFP